MLVVRARALVVLLLISLAQVHGSRTCTWTKHTNKNWGAGKVSAVTLVQKGGQAYVDVVDEVACQDKCGQWAQCTAYTWVPSTCNCQWAKVCWLADDAVLADIGRANVAAWPAENKRNSGVPASCADAAYVGGDPITIFRGVEYKFEMPNFQLLPLLQTSDLVLRGSAFPGEAAEEQWIEQVTVETLEGEMLLDVKIRHDIADFRRNDKLAGSFDTVEIRAPYWATGLLTMPENEGECGSRVPTDGQKVSAADECLQTDKYVISPEFVHPQDIVIQPFRIKNPAIGLDSATPFIEGVYIACKSMKLAVTSSSALEFYWDDKDDHRALKYAHLDIQFLDMQNASSWTGLLPEVWGLVPGPSTASVGQPRSEESVTESSMDPSRELQRLILSNLM